VKEMPIEDVVSNREMQNALDEIDAKAAFLGIPGVAKVKVVSDHADPFIAGNIMVWTDSDYKGGLPSSFKKRSVCCVSV
jgi:hypothetical protein